MDDERGLTIEQLAERTGASVRTIRYYIGEGLLPGPGARGKAALYDADHLLRLRLIRRLVEARQPLAAIRERLAGLTRAEMRALLAEEEARAATIAAETSPRALVAALLERARAARVAHPPAAHPERPGARAGQAPPAAERARRPTAPPPTPAAPPPDPAPRVPPPPAMPLDDRATPRASLPSAAPAAPAAPSTGPVAPPTPSPAAPTAAALPPAPPASPPPHWQRHDLAPGVELHVRADAAEAQRALIARLLAAAHPPPPDG